MSDYRRTSRTLLAYLLAVPVIVLVYIGAFGTRVWSALRPAVATLLGATVIGSVYADEALKRAPATPMRAAAVLALAVALVGPGLAPAPAWAASDPAEAVIAAARDYLGSPYRLGSEGPRYFDCSGFLYRAFSDAGELPRIGGLRLRAAGYMRWFVSRGLFTKNADNARRGDLVVWNLGDHIGIYLGDGKAISALINPYGITIHSIYGINQKISYFLQVDWSNGDGPSDPVPSDPVPSDPVPVVDQVAPDEPAVVDPGAGPGNGDRAGSSEDSTGGNTPTDGSTDGPDNPTNQPANDQAGLLAKQGYATGTMNMRASADPQARIIGWVSRGKTFKIIGTGNSPAGYLWYEVQTVSGKQGWIFSYWVREV